MKTRALFAAAVMLMAAGCSQSDGTIYTLYRNSLLAGAEARIHVATFDAADGEDYNRENCELARDLFNRQDGVGTKFWCEKGRYRGRG